MRGGAGDRLLGPCLATVVLFAAWPGHVHAATLSPAASAKLAPSLTPLALVEGAEPVPVWVEFGDKGDLDPRDRAAKLADAEAALTPRARARRERAGLRPLVDALDLPIDTRYLEALRLAGYAPYGASRWFNRVAVRASGAGLARLAEFPFVHRVQPVAFGRLSRPPAFSANEVTASRSAAFSMLGGPSPILYGYSRAQVTQIGVPAVHDSGYIGTGVLIAVLDEGFNYFDKHTALRNLAVDGRTRDFVDGDTSVQDTLINPFIQQHGTWCLSAIGGNAPGTLVSPAFGAAFALARTENSGSEKPIEMVNWTMAAEWADSLGADIISSSLGYNVFPDSLGQDYTYADMDGHTTIITRAAEIAASRGILVVNSAGNEGQSYAWGYKIIAPADANGDSVLAVGAVDSTGLHAGYSSKGPTYDGRIKPDLSARGTGAWLASASGNPNGYTQLSGTSFSCPIVSGLAACLMQARPQWPAVLIARALKETASRAALPDTIYGWGLPNGLAVLRWTPDSATAPPAPRANLLALAGANPVRLGPDVVLRVSAPAGATRRGTLRLFDAQGRMIRELWSGEVEGGGSVDVVWDGQSARGRRAGEGVYFAHLDLGGAVATLRLVSLR